MGWRTLKIIVSLPETIENIETFLWFQSWCFHHVEGAVVQIVTRQYLIKRHLGAESSEVLRLSYSLWVPSSGIPRAWRVQREVRACSSNIWSNNPLNDQNKSFVVYCNNRLASAIPPSSMVPHCRCYSFYVSSTIKFKVSEDVRKNWRNPPLLHFIHFSENLNFQQ